MATKYGQIKLRLPKGFSELLHAFAKEVLREQPSDISKFGADFFHELLNLRNGSGEDPLKRYANIEDRLKKDKHFGTDSGDVLRPVNSNIRGNEIREEDAATKIQANYKGHVVRRQREKEGMAATKIQAGYRGHMTRTRLRNQSIQPTLKQESVVEKADDEEPAHDDEHQAATYQMQSNGEEIDDEQQQAAALRIQANYRGYKTRKEIRDTKDSKVDLEDKGDNMMTEDDNVPDGKTVDVTESQQSYSGVEIEDEQVNEVKEDEDAPHPNEDEEPEQTQDMVKTSNEYDVGEPQAEVDDEAVQDEEEKGEGADDPDLEKAALRIQAQFRGYKTRKEMKKDLPDKTSTTVEQPEISLEEETTTDPVDIEVAGDDAKQELAATKIQAQYRGYKARKHLKDRKATDDDVVAGDDGDVDEVAGAGAETAD